MDIHARIYDFLQQQSLVVIPPIGRGDNVTKAAFVPFVRQASIFRYYVMKPVARHPDRPPPEFQLCKGTRMAKHKDGWADVESLPARGELESLAAASLREGIEELGLKLENIKQIYDAGPYGFSSVATGAPKKMWLFAAEMSSGDFSDAIDASTAERTWLTQGEFDVAGRPDHRYILQDMEKRLKAHCK